MAGASCEPVKVVFISTHYIETDPMNFKSVVQSLTGKDSSVARMQKSSFVDQKKKICGGSIGGGVGHGLGRVCDSSVSSLSQNLFSNDFDMMLSEQPPMDDLLWLWAQ